MSANELKFKLETFHTVDFRTLNDFITAEFGREYEFLVDMESHNDTSHKFVVTGELDEYESDEVQEWIQDGYRSYMALSLLNTLCKSGKIPAGTYLVDVCW